MAPACVRIGVGLALRPPVVDEPLAVRVGGHVGGVDGNLPAHVRVVLAQRSRQRVQAPGDSLALLA